VNRADRMLAALRDGTPWSRAEIFDRVGFMLTNNAASELRDRGFTVIESRRGGEYFYQLLNPAQPERLRTTAQVERPETVADLPGHSRRAIAAAPAGRVGPEPVPQLSLLEEVA